MKNKKKRATRGEVNLFVSLRGEAGSYEKELPGFDLYRFHLGQKDLRVGIGYRQKFYLRKE